MAGIGCGLMGLWDWLRCGIDWCGLNGIVLVDHRYGADEGVRQIVG